MFIGVRAGGLHNLLESVIMKLVVPDPSLVVLVGVSGSGKTTFAQKHFARFESISSDFCRGLVSNSENDQTATPAAFELLHDITAKRLAAGLLTVIDATNLQKTARGQLLRLAEGYGMQVVAIVLQVPIDVCIQRNAARRERDVGGQVVHYQAKQMREAFAMLTSEPYSRVHVLGINEISRVQVVRQRDRKQR